MKSFFISIFLITSSFSLCAQLEGSNWFFGNQKGLNFSSGQLKIITDSPLVTAEGSASYSTPSGDLLFFTNGGGRPPLSGESPGELFDADFNLMYSMNGQEGGGFSAQQSSIIFPVPQGDNTFYLFTMEESEFDEGGAIPGQPQGRGLSYFVIDMNLNGGAGGMVTANEAVFLPTYESLTAVQHDNGQDYWVIITDATNEQFIVIPITAIGVGLPQWYDVPTGKTNGGFLKASPDRSKLYADGLLYDFDASSGEITNPTILPNDLRGAGSFSPNGKYLYVGVSLGFPNLQLYQFDVQQNDLTIGQQVIANLNGSFFSSLQLAPDATIYFFTDSLGSGKFNRIACANSTNATVELDIISDLGNVISLPNFTDHIFRNDAINSPLTVDLGPDLDNCTNAPLVLDAGNTGMTYSWSTGDTTQTISIDQPGNYSVTVSNACGQEGSDDITVLSSPQFQLLNTSVSICAGELVTVPLNLSGSYPITISYLNNGMPEIAFLSTINDSLAVFIQGPTLLSFSLLSSGNCSVPLTDEYVINIINSDTVYINEFTCVAADTGTVIAVIPYPGECSQTQITQTQLAQDIDCPVELFFTMLQPPSCPDGNDGQVCLTFEAGLLPMQYSIRHNNSGSTVANGAFTSLSEKLSLNQIPAGQYVIDLRSPNEISSSIPFVLPNPPGVQIVLPTEITITEGDLVLLQPDLIIPTTTLGRWEDALGNILCENCTSVLIEPIEQSTYFFIVEALDCKYEEELVVKVKNNQKVFFPNSFSPNNDGNNDVYEFFIAKNAAHITSFQIYDRWGQLVFAAYDTPAGNAGLNWDGTFKGKKYNPSVFVYLAEIIFQDGTARFYQGDILLMR